MAWTQSSGTGTGATRGRIDDPRKVWKLTEMDLKSYSRWDEYTRARDAMFEATDTPWAPWWIAHTDDKERGRLDVINHLLNQVPHTPLEPREVELPRRKPGAEYSSPELPLKHIPALF